MIALLLLLVQSTVESPSEAFARAEGLYQEQRFAEAADVYESIRAAGIEDGVLYYNLGNAYFKAGMTGRAILSYERARLLLPGDDDVTMNLRFANELVADVVVEEPLPAGIRWVVDAYRRVEIQLLAKILSVVFVLGGLALTFWLADPRPGLREPLTVALLLCAVISVVSGAALMAKTSSRAGRREAIVLTPNAYVRSGPGEANPRLAEIHEGLKVRILSERDGWFQVGLVNGLTGWLRRGEVEAIDASLTSPAAG